MEKHGNTDGDRQESLRKCSDDHKQGHLNTWSVLSVTLVWHVVDNDIALLQFSTSPFCLQDAI